MKQGDTFERWCLVDDGSTFEEWYELEEQRERLREQERAQYSHLSDWYLNAIAVTNDPARLAYVERQYQGQRNLLDAEAKWKRANALGNAFGGVLGGLFQWSRWTSPWHMARP